MKSVRIKASLVALVLIGASAIAQQSPVRAEQVPATAVRAVADDAMSGTAAWYGRKFNGRRTASGKRFNASALTASHASLPFGTRVRVVNTENNKSVLLTINDRLNPSAGRVIDVSRAAAQRLGMMKMGTAPVRIERAGARSGNAGRGRVNRAR